MLEVSVLSKKIWQTGQYVTERKITFLCPVCKWLKTYRELAPITRTYSRLDNRCVNSDCGNIMPDIGRLIDQKSMRLDFTRKHYKKYNEDQNFGNRNKAG